MSESRDGDIMVTVCIFAYNHENYIEEAIQSVLMQECDFTFEILIGEDGSIDSTPKILENLRKEFPERLNIIYQDQSKKIYIDGKPTGRYNFLSLLNRAKGKYIALLDGDDYWTDPLKLQKQVDFLEANPEFSMCFHPTYILKNGEMTLDALIDVPEVFSIEYLAEKGNFIHTASVVFKRGLFDLNQQVFKKIPAGDYVVNMLNAKHGPIIKISEPMAAYRVHGGGIWSTLTASSINKKMVKQLSLMLPLFKNHPEVKKILKNKKRKYRELVMSENQLIYQVFRVRDSFLFRVFGIKR